MARVLVIGSGGAGLSAALEAVRNGAEVLVLEAGDQVGGATARAGGVVYAAGTDVQRAAGIDDDVDELVAYYMTLTHHQLEPRLLRVSAEGELEGLDLHEHGMPAYPEYVIHGDSPHFGGTLKPTSSAVGVPVPQPARH